MRLSGLFADKLLLRFLCVMAFSILAALGVAAEARADDVPVLDVTVPAFDNDYVGYVQPAAKSITLSLPLGSTEPVYIHGVDSSSPNFTTIPTLGNQVVLWAGDSDGSWTVQPAADLPAGNHSAMITVKYGLEASAGIPGRDAAPISKIVNFRVIDPSPPPPPPPPPPTPTYSATIDPASHVFPSMAAGYTTLPEEAFTVASTGTGMLTGLSAALASGANFEIIPPFLPVALTSDGSATVTVRPKSGLPEGGYSDTLRIAGDDGISLSASVSLDVTAAPTYTATLTPTTHAFSDAIVGYDARAARQFTVTNTGTAAITGLHASLSSGGTAFEISSALSAMQLDPDATATVSVRPRTGLSAADAAYTGVLTVAGDNGVSLSADLSFNVTSTPTYTITVDPTSWTFPTVSPGYERPEEHIFTITNTGAGTVTGLRADLDSDPSRFEIYPTLNFNQLAPGATARVGVYPKVGLAAGSYSDKLKISGQNGVFLEVPLSFNVGNTSDAVIEPANVVFPSMFAGYDEQMSMKFIVRLVNESASGLSVSTVSLEGSFFEITGTDEANRLDDFSKTYSIHVRPVVGLSARETPYTGQVVVKCSNGLVLAAGLSFTVKAPSAHMLTIDPPVHTFMEKETASPPTTEDLQQFVVTNVGTETITNLTAEVSKGFSITQGLSRNGAAVVALAPSESATVSLWHNAALPVGQHSGLLTVRGDPGVSAEAGLQFQVLFPQVGSGVFCGAADIGVGAAGAFLLPLLFPWWRKDEDDEE